jgi:hypothetical protein
MSWWTNEPSTDVIGDPPADFFTRGLSSIAQARARLGASPPTLVEFLAVLASALRKKTRDWCGPSEDVPFQELEASVEEPDGTLRSYKQDPHFESEDMVLRLCEAFEAITLQYEDVLGRPPRRSELLAVASFVLGYEPNAYLAIPEDAAVRQIIAVREPGSPKES